MPIVATRTQVCRALSSAVAALAPTQDVTSTSDYVHQLPFGATRVKLHYANICVNADNSENNSPGPLTIAAGVVDATGSVVGATFNGAATYTLAANELVETDWIDLPTAAAAGASIHSRSTIFVAPGSTVVYPVSGQPAVFVDSAWPVNGGDGVGCRVAAASNATPIVITTGGAHQATNGQRVRIAGVLGNTAANGDYYVTVLSSTTLALYTDSGRTTAVAGNGAYTANTGVMLGTNMAATGSGACRARASGETNYWGPIAISAAAVTGKRSTSIAGVGNSIEAGSNDSTTLAGQGFLARAFNSAFGIPNTNLARGSTRADQWAQFLVRRQVALLADHVLCNYGTNDLATSSVPTLQANLSTIWYYFAQAGKRVAQTTIGPRTTSTDSWATATNQSFEGSTAVSGATNATPVVLTASAHRLTTGQQVQVSGVGGNTAANGTWWVEVLSVNTVALYSDAARTSPVAGNGSYTSGGSAAAKESNRVTLNAWLHDGAPMLNGVAVATGSNAAGTVRVGQAGHPLWRVIDLWQPIEVNASNVLTRHGGRWLANGTANYLTNDGIHPVAAGHLLLTGAIELSWFEATRPLAVLSSRRQRRRVLQPRDSLYRFGRLVTWQPTRLSDVCLGDSPDLARPWTRGTYWNGSNRSYMMPSDRPGGGAHVQLGAPGTLIGNSPFNPQFRIPMDSAISTVMQGPRSFAMWLYWEGVAGSAASMEFFWSLNADLNAFSSVWGRWFTNPSGQILNDNGPPGGSWSALYTMPRSRWVHLTVTYDPATQLQTLYADGERIGVLTESGARSYSVGFETLVFGSGTIANLAPISVADFAQFATCLDGAQVRDWYEDAADGHPIALAALLETPMVALAGGLVGPPPGSLGLLGVGR